ncbi:helix-turn-helix domain-containing protein [Oceanicella actignis]|uniref:Protein RodZ, contains Xre-like HTH and DUF4115 domains n=1 Tax=Oceanicella actignis TaxID=1189325 RepID=A0A1M7S1R5_9RHOB|nr:helix-turn-helix domain-containing protein [Oceanicella actignis]SES90837.1 protein RodZ, contains Xre-like HTH and DUF4115 domains [Oceanicella actignis]SHN52547.1 protein RodZ, contains Xre-like HTH and DUF4115 domains [Oceanicella actignis]
MPDHEVPTLRGFDSYEVKLGDELRGHRASLGKSLLDVQRDLRIRAAYIDAIENCDPSVIPNKGFVAGYVRAYARYLQLDPDEVYRRFCEESGFRGPAAAARPAAPAGQGVLSLVRGRGQGDADFARSRLAAPLGSARRIGPAVPLGAIASIAVLAALTAGLGYGAWFVLQEVQRVAIAPSPEAPAPIETPPNIALPSLSFEAFAETRAIRSAEHEAALAALYAPRDISAPDVALRDGPIQAIDPDEAGVYAPGVRPSAPRAALAAATPADPASSPASSPAAAPAPGDQPALSASASGDRPAPAAPPGPAVELVSAEPAQPPAAAQGAEGRKGVWILTVDDAWLRVRARDGSTLAQRVFKPGERFRLPDGAEGAQLRAGNAGGVYLQVDDVIYGPLGRPGGVAKRVTLAPDAIRAAFAPVERLPDPGAAPAPAPRAEARLTLE